MKALQQASQFRSLGRPHDHARATTLENEANSLLAPVTADLALREAVPEYDDAKPLVRDTLENPTSVAIDASEARLDLLSDAGVLELALDAADSIDAKNSLEKMLAHQAGACHSMAMKLFARAENEKLPPVELVRLTNGAARLMDIFQSLLLTLQRLRVGGKQTMVVQHVNVEGGAQAIVAGRLQAQGGGGPGIHGN